jgi:hypothetical protein
MVVTGFPHFLGDAERADLTNAIGNIGKALIERSADFLFGAGMSAPSDLPTGDKLAKQLLAQFFENTPVSDTQLQRWTDTVPFECIAGAVESMRKGRANLTRHLEETILTPTADINNAHKKFLSIYNWDGQRRLRRIYTTNFDLLLEKAFAGRGVTVTEKNANRIETIEADQDVPVLHLHGILNEEYQITEADLYSERFRKLHMRFEMALRESAAFTFIGYSMTDPDFRTIYLDYQDDIRNRRDERKDSYVVSPVDNLEDYLLGKAIWAERGAVWLPLNAESFFGGLRDILESKTTKEIETVIMKKYRLKDEQAYREKIAQTAAILEINHAEAIQFLYETRPITG